MTAAVGWAVVGPEGVEVMTIARSKAQAHSRGQWYHMAVGGEYGDDTLAMAPGYRLARVRIEVIEESDDE